jgi:succinate dehydrogenase/fumarate reductase flavoprotein subunit
MTSSVTLIRQTFDVAVVGGGTAAALAALEAIRAGVTVALISE